MLNRCLDDAIAAAVSEFAVQERAVSDSQSLGQSASLKNLLFTAITAFEALQTGTVGIAGNTGSLVHRSLLAMSELVWNLPHRRYSNNESKSGGFHPRSRCPAALAPRGHRARGVPKRSPV